MRPESAEPAFTMGGAREALEAGAAHIEQQIVAIEQAVASNPGLAFDLAKTLVESACRGILYERNGTYEKAWELPKLLRETLGHLQIVPATLVGNSDVAQSLRKTTGGLQTVIQGICEIRNSHGFASHGRDPAFCQLDDVQALLVARAADAIVSFLFRLNRAADACEQQLEPTYTDSAVFNDYVDEINGVVQIFELNYKASEILFQVDPRAYQDYLANFVPDDAEAEG